MRRKLTVSALVLVLLVSLSVPAFAASSGNLTIGFQVYGYEAADFAENGEGEYVGNLELTAYRIGYQWNKKQVTVSNAGGDVRYLEFTEFAEAPSWSPYYIATQKVAIRQTAEEQVIIFTYNGPAAAKVNKTVTVTVPAYAMPVLAGVAAVSSDLPELNPANIAADENGGFAATVATNAQFVRMQPNFAVAEVPEGAVLTARVYVNDEVQPDVALTDMGGGIYQVKQQMLMSPGANNDEIRYDLIYKDTVFGSFVLRFEAVLVLETLIDSINITGLAPAAGADPADLAPVTGDTRYVIEAVDWTPGADSGFAAGTVYTAAVTVNANEGHLFNGNYDALNIMSGGLLNNIAVAAADEDIKLKDLFDYGNMPNFERFSFQVTFLVPAAPVA